MNLFWTPARALARLAFRRAVGPVFLVWCAGVAALLAGRDWAPPITGLGAASPDDVRSIAHGLARQGIWSGVALAIVPFLVLRAARTVGAWRTGEVDWLASRAAARETILVWTWVGSWIAALLVLAATGILAETRAGPGIPSLRLAGTIGAQGSGWVEGRRALRWSASDPHALAPPGSRVRFELALGSSAGPGAEVILEVRRGAPGQTSESSSRTAQRVGTRAAIEVDLPPGGGDLEFELTCADDRDRAFLMSKAGELWAPVGSDRAAGWALLTRAAVALAAWLALALGLGAWMQATSAALLVLALMLPAWLALEPSSIWPGGDFLQALAITGRGRVPPAIDGRSLLAAAFVAALGLGLARWSLASWRRDS